MEAADYKRDGQQRLSWVYICKYGGGGENREM